jgi:pheromone shutdown protein TraB
VRTGKRRKAECIQREDDVHELSSEFERVVFVPVIHTDTESVKNASHVVAKTKPDVVAVELDRTRYQQLIENKNQAIENQGIPSGDTISNLMQQIALLEKDLGQMTGAMAGEEMLAAIKAGRKIGAKIALVDRPIEVTAQALAQVPLYELYKLTDMIPGATQEVADEGAGNLFDMLKENANVESLMAEFKKEFPVLSSVLIEQRDSYIANAVRSILNDVRGKVVVVLGSGHIEGVSRILKDTLAKETGS